MNKIIQGDCLDKLKELPENSVDSIVTDPPAGISFMGKSWDSDKGGRDNWIKWMSDVATECKRVLKPGGHAFVWAIPRTSHWTATAWENAGFEIRDVVAHVFGSGFPKSLNIGKAVDKLQGNERVELGDNPNTRKSHKEHVYELGLKSEAKETKGTSEWEGWGTALKPAREDWILMRKPIGCKTIAENVLKYGTGGINIDESRVGTEGGGTVCNNIGENGKCLGHRTKDNIMGITYHGEVGIKKIDQGRFPANLIHDGSDEVKECFPETKSGGAQNGSKIKTNASIWHSGNKMEMDGAFYDSGSASRFFKSINTDDVNLYKREFLRGYINGSSDKDFKYELDYLESKYEEYIKDNEESDNFKSIIYQAKASKSERNKGCEGLEDRKSELNSGGIGRECSVEKRTEDGSENAPTMKNHHPTVKPIALMTYLIKMVTPKGGVVLDPFAGSGSTLVAAKQNGYQYIGIEMTPEYIPIIEARLK